MVFYDSKKLVTLIFLNFICHYQCVCTHVRTRMGGCLCLSHDKDIEVRGLVVNSFSSMDSRNWTQVIKFLWPFCMLSVSLFYKETLILSFWVRGSWISEFQTSPVYIEQPCAPPSERNHLKGCKYCLCLYLNSHFC